MNERISSFAESFELRANGTIWREQDDQVVVLDLETSVYLTVAGPAAVVWKLLARRTTLDEMIEAVLQEFDVDRETACVDLIEFLDDLSERKLLQ